MINRAWVAHARALAESLRAHEPDCAALGPDRRSARWSDRPGAPSRSTCSPRAISSSTDFDAMSVRYDITELCCALKPAVIATCSAERCAGRLPRQRRTALRAARRTRERARACPVPAHPPPAGADAATTGASPTSWRSCSPAPSNLGFAAPRARRRGRSRAAELVGGRACARGSRLDPAERWSTTSAGPT